MRRGYKIIAFLLLAAVIGYFAGSAAFLLQFPTTIRLTEFDTHSLNIGLPLSATFHSETAAVAKVNNQPVCEDLSINLQRPLTIQTQAEGQAEMTIGAFGVPIRRVVLDVVPEVDVVPMGTAIGVRINTDGVMVLGTGSFLGTDGLTHSPSGEILKGGDLILSANGHPIKTKEELAKYVANSRGDIDFIIRRDYKDTNVTITPAKAETDHSLKIGVWVRDSTKGIGTLTFYNPRTKAFGALGHGIMDVDTNRLISVKSGVIMPSTVISVKKGTRGVPGELEGNVDSRHTLGTVTANSPSGIYGKLNPDTNIVTRNPVPIATRSQIQEGPATILTNVTGSEVKEYDIYVENVNRFTTDDTKGMVIRITDPELLKVTGGIVQGMSGSPILQNGRLIGAVTHVFVQDPTKGYGIFIEAMIGG